MSTIEIRNVFLHDSNGTIIAGFWQYGDIPWSTFTTRLSSIIVVPAHRWAIFKLDPAGLNNVGEQQPFSSAEIVPPDHYVMLRQGWFFPSHLSSLHFAFRLRNSFHSSDRKESPYAPTDAIKHSGSGGPLHKSLAQARWKVFDYPKSKCYMDPAEGNAYLPSEGSFSAFYVSHVSGSVTPGRFSGWTKATITLIADDGPSKAVGGYSKIDSIQNVIMLRGDLRNAWDNYEFGVDPDDDYRITCFINGLSDVYGERLTHDHIVDAKLRPLDILFQDHFLQGVLKQVKGAGEPTWDYENTFGDGSFDLSRENIWRSAEGKERLELELRDRLFETLTAQTV